MNRPWLADTSWNVVVETNRLLCVPKGAFHGPTNEGYENARSLWNSKHTAEMSLIEAIELCRKCHRIAPFCNYNGNTFVAIMRIIIGNIGLPRETTAALRSLAGHVIAGTATPEEETLLLETINQALPPNPQ